MATAGTCRGADPSMIPQNGTCLWFNDGCMIGCSRCDGNATTQGRTGCNSSGPMEPTLPDRFRSWPDESLTPRGRYGSCGHSAGSIDGMKYHPWRAPGFAPVESPCGLAGGYYTPTNGFPGNGGYPPAGVQHGMDGRHVPESVRSVWPKGSHQEVAVAVNANHGGGYSYRMCPKPNKFEQVTEDCFQRHPLNFVGDTQWVQWGDKISSRIPVPAVRVSEGTNPRGSQWTRFPLPACGGGLGGDAAGGSDVAGRVQAGPDCNRTQFPPPVPGLFGYGLTQCLFPNLDIPTAGLFNGSRRCTEEEVEKVKRLFNVNFVDLVEVPTSLPAGDYVLSWRHDSEQTPQVWAACADITLTDAPTMV